MSGFRLNGRIPDSIVRTHHANSRDARDWVIGAAACHPAHQAAALTIGT